MAFLELVTAVFALYAGSRDRPVRVGFIWHYPFVDVGTEMIASCGGTSHIARVPWAEVQPQADRWDFTALHRQLREAEKGRFRLVLLLECNPFCAPPWLRKQVQDVGETVRDPWGNARDIPSTTSRLFQRAQRRFIKRTVAEVMRHDTRRLITHYQVGVEWWFPFEWRYALADISRFRLWLARRYGSIYNLNRSWGSNFATFAAVEPPRLFVSGGIWERGRRGLMPIEALPGAPQSSSASQDWMTFWHEAAAEYINALAAIARQEDPSRPTMTFLTFSFAQGVEWDYVDWSAIRLDEVCARAASIKEIGMQLPAARGDSFRIAVGLDIARKYRKPMDVLDLLDFTDGVRAGRSVHARATHTAIQHGASSLYYCCWNGAKDFNFYPDWPMADIRSMLLDARRTLEAVRGMHVTTDGAIVLPITPGVPGSAEAGSRAAASFMGWYKLLQAMHRTVDVITFAEIERGLDMTKYPWIVLPACETAPQQAVRRLAGLPLQTRLVVAGEGPARDERGAPLRPKLSNATVLPDYGTGYAGDLVRDAAAGDTPPLVLWPARTAAEEALREDAAKTLERLLPTAHQGIRVSVTPSEPTPGEGSRAYVSATVRRSTERLAVHAVNLGDRNAERVTITVPAAYASALQLWCDGVERQVPGQHLGDAVRVAVPTFRMYCLLIARRHAGAVRRQTSPSSSTGRTSSSRGVSASPSTGRTSMSFSARRNSVFAAASRRAASCKTGSSSAATRRSSGRLARPSPPASRSTHGASSPYSHRLARHRSQPDGRPRPSSGITRFLATLPSRP